MTDQLKWALQELVITAAIAFALPFFGWLSGLSELPNLEAGEAALRAAVVAALVAAGKFVINYLTNLPARTARRARHTTA